MIWNLIGGWLGGITSPTAVDVLPPSPLGRMFRSNVAEANKTDMVRGFAGSQGSDMVRPWKGDLK